MVRSTTWPTLFRCSSAASCLRRRTATTAFTTSVSAIRVLVTKRPSWYLLFHPTKYRSESISILSSPEPSWSGLASVKSPTWRSRPSCINNPCIPVVDVPAWNNNLSGNGVSSPFDLIYLASFFLPLPSGSSQWCLVLGQPGTFSVDFASVLLRLT